MSLADALRMSRQSLDIADRSLEIVQKLGGINMQQARNIADLQLSVRSLQAENPPPIPMAPPPPPPLPLAYEVEPQESEQSQVEPPPPPIEEFEHYQVESFIPPPPPLTAPSVAPPPPPPSVGVPPPPPLIAQMPSVPTAPPTRGGLLDAIRLGTPLRKVADVQLAGTAAPIAASDVRGGLLAAIRKTPQLKKVQVPEDIQQPVPTALGPLANIIMARRAAIEGEGDDDEEEGDDDEEEDVSEEEWKSRLMRNYL